MFLKEVRDFISDSSRELNNLGVYICIVCFVRHDKWTDSFDDADDVIIIDAVQIALLACLSKLAGDFGKVGVRILVLRKLSGACHTYSFLPADICRRTGLSYGKIGAIAAGGVLLTGWIPLTGAVAGVLRVKIQVLHVPLGDWSRRASPASRRNGVLGKFAVNPGEFKPENDNKPKLVTSK